MFRPKDSLSLCLAAAIGSGLLGCSAESWHETTIVSNARGQEAKITRFWGPRTQFDYPDYIDVQGGANCKFGALKAGSHVPGIKQPTQREIPATRCQHSVGNGVQITICVEGKKVDPESGANIYCAQFNNISSIAPGCRDVPMPVLKNMPDGTKQPVDSVMVTICDTEPR